MSKAQTHVRELHLFLSPHLDDAVLSCGGTLYQLTAEGHTVVVYTVMAGRPPRNLPDSPLLRELHARWQTAGDPVVERRYEDIKALRALGVKARHGTIPDCVYRVSYGPGGERRALYPNEESLWGPVHPADTAPLLLEATPLLYHATDVLHVPLGVGGHVDHRLVREWGLRLARAHNGVRVRFYEDYPYSRDAAALEAALQGFAPRRLVPILRPLDEAALRARVEAVAHYQSQLSTFWNGVEDMARAVAEDARRVGGGQLAEREWELQPEAGAT